MKPNFRKKNCAGSSFGKIGQNGENNKFLILYERKLPECYPNTLEAQIGYIHNRCENLLNASTNIQERILIDQFAW